MRGDQSCYSPLIKKLSGGQEVDKFCARQISDLHVWTQYSQSPSLILQLNESNPGGTFSRQIRKNSDLKSQQSSCLQRLICALPKEKLNLIQEIKKILLSIVLLPC